MLACTNRYIRQGCVRTRVLALSIMQEYSYSTEAGNYQLLQQSMLPMDHFQSSLPRLPIPAIEKTCQRYLNSQKPILPEEEYKKVTDIVKRFKEGEGISLDKELRDRDKQNKHTSYITGPWFDMYLKDRRSTVLTHNPCMMFTDDPRPPYNNQLLRATNMLISSLRFLRSLREKSLEPDVFHLNPKKSDNQKYRKVMRLTPGPLRFYLSALAYKTDFAVVSDRGDENCRFHVQIAVHENNTKDSTRITAVLGSLHEYVISLYIHEFPYPLANSDICEKIGPTLMVMRVLAYPLDMSQFVNLLNSTRIPEIGGKDTLLADPTATHMMVLRNGNFYIFDVLDEQGFIKDKGVIHACLDYILKDKTAPSASPLGTLTTLDRDSWSKYRKELENAGNAEALRTVDTAAFCLTLDDDYSEDNVATVRQFLHGDGTNRWFDKSFQLIILSNGQASLNFEHSWGDGVAVLRYMNEVYKDSTERSLVHPGDAPSSIDPSRHVRILDWKIPDSVKTGVADAKAQFAKRLSSLSVDVLECPGAGKTFAKKEGISPDALMQMIFQVSYHRMSGKTVATYESCSTAAFKHGRTETIRPATVATKALSEALNGSSRPSGKELRSLIQQASQLHSQLTREAAMGQGFDRHLFGLRKIAEERGDKLPELYTHPSYAQINHNILSTSTLSSPAVLCGGFAPVVQDGLGIAYGIFEDRLGCIVSSHPGFSDGKQFLESMATVVDDIISTLRTTQK